MMTQSHHPDAALFKAFVDRKLIIPIARKQTRNTLISWEDAAQAAYAKLWQATCNGKFRQGNLEDYCHWATRVCCFAIIDYLQHSHQRQYDSLDAPIPGTDIPRLDTLEAEFTAMDVVERAELHQQILKCLTDLDRKHATTLYTTIGQSLLLGKTQREIAQDLNLDPSKICRCVKAIYQQIALLYQPKDDDQPPTDRRRSDQQW